MTGTQLADVPEVVLSKVVLNPEGHLVSGKTVVPDEAVPWHLERLLRVPVTATDIFVFVHGWRNTPRGSEATARLLFGGLSHIAQRACEYERMPNFRPHFVAVQWPSMSPPTGAGYRMIRDRAHEMSTHGQASRVLGRLLGYLHSHRKVPIARKTAVLANRDGQFLHCVGHSFGGRFLGEAIKWAADPPRTATLTWRWRSAHPFAVDSLTVFQMAAKPSIFDQEFIDLRGSAPLHGPISLTFTGKDRALSLWHRRVEGVAGLGAVGAVGDVTTIRLKALNAKYSHQDFRTKIVNVDASWLYTSVSNPFTGAHSDFMYAESAHLLLSVANLTRSPMPFPRSSIGPDVSRG